MTKKQDLPDYLHKAYDIFIEECNGHLETLKSTTPTDENAETISTIFHTIKGGAGFLQMDEIAALAKEGELLFKTSPISDEAKEKFTTLVEDFEARYSEISS